MKIGVIGLILAFLALPPAYLGLREFTSKSSSGAVADASARNVDTTRTPAVPSTSSAGESSPSQTVSNTTPPLAVISEVPAGTYRADWSTGMNGWVTSSDWKVVQGMLVNDGGGSSQDLTAMAPDIFGSVKDFLVEAEIQLVRYNFTFAESFGLIVRSSNEGGGYGVGHCAGDCGESINERVGTVIAIDGSGFIKNAPFDPGTIWHTYRAEVRGNEIRLIIDGTLMVKTVDNRFLESGRIGLWCDHAQINVKNFVVAPL
jgi:hypothetical protein